MTTGVNKLFPSRMSSRTTAVRQGDHSNRAKVDALARTEAGNILAYFSHRVTRKADAADLLGETLLVLWRRADSIPDDDAERRMWMFGIARKVLATYHRAKNRLKASVENVVDSEEKVAQYDQA